MFVRKKKNKSGVVSIQVIDKSSGKYKVIKTIGSSSDANEIDLFYQQGLDYIQQYEGQKIIDFTSQDFKKTVKQSIQNIAIEGIHLLLGKIYSEIGCPSAELRRAIAVDDEPEALDILKIHASKLNEL